jgi:branched-chain amino acid transport system permease protein
MGIEQILAAIPWEKIIIQTVNGIVTGMILALIASGLTLIFGIMDVVNFAHGELFMLGAYVGVVVIATSGSFWLALIVATLVVALLGAALQITTLRPLLGRDPLTTILATFGISLVLQNYALWQFGPVARKIPEPFTGYFTLFYLEYPWYRLLIAALSAAIIGAFWLRPWASPSPGSTLERSPSAPAWPPPAACCSVPSSASTMRWGSTGY